MDNDIGHKEDLLIAMIFPLGISAFICLLYHRMKTARQKTEADEHMPGFTCGSSGDRYTHTTRERTYDLAPGRSPTSGGSSCRFRRASGGSSGGLFWKIKTKTPR